MTDPWPTKAVYFWAAKPLSWLFIGLVFLPTLAMLLPGKALATDILVYKSPTCGCCSAWIDHLKENGFEVEARDHTDMNPVKAVIGVPRHLRSCHTAVVDGYVVEGHVPADLITRMLTEKPDIKGLAVPGMPMGSPGMEGPRKDVYDVLTFDSKGRTSVYATR